MQTKSILSSGAIALVATAAVYAGVLEYRGFPLWF